MPENIVPARRNTRQNSQNPVINQSQTMNNSTKNTLKGSAIKKMECKCDCDINMEFLEKKIDNLFDKLSAKFEEKLNSWIQKKIEDVIEPLNEKTNKLETAVATLESKIAELEKKLNANAKQINQEKINNDRNERLKNIIIYGVPDCTDEEMKSVVDKACKKYDGSFSSNNVKCLRLKKSANNYPPILVKFNSKGARDAIFFNYIKKRDLMLTDVMDGANGLDCRIYINEHLMKDDAEIVKKCRELKRENKLQRFFLRNGVVFIQLSNGTKRKISDVAELLAAI